MSKQSPHRLLLGAVLALHAALLATYFVPVVAGTDDNGYHLAARMLERHGRIYQEVDDPLTFVGRMWVMVDDGHYYPKYPPLYPALVATSMRLAGELAGLLVSPLLAWSSVLAIYCLCRVQRLPADIAVLGAFVMATAPLANSFAVSQVSHATSLALLAWGYVLFFRAQADAPPRYPMVMMIASGLLIGYAAGVRYTDALLVAPGLVWLLLDRRRPRRSLARLGAWLGAWLLPCLLVAAYHWRAFGGPLTTAYSFTEEQGGFALAYMVENLRLYAASLPVLLIGPLTILTGLGWLLAWRRNHREGLFHLAWLLPTLLTYLAYYWAPEDHPRSYVRFLLPLLIPGILLAMQAVHELPRGLRTGRRGRRAILITVLAVQGVWGVAASLEQLELLFGFNTRVRQSVELVRRHAEPGSVVFGELTLLDSLDYHREHDLYWANLLDQKLLDDRLDRTLQAGPDSLQLRRAEYLRDNLVEVEPAVHRSRLRAVIEAPLRENRQVWIAGSGATRAKLERFARDNYRLEKIAGLPTTGRPHRLFEPGRTVSRAAAAGPAAEPFNLWRVSLRR